MKENWVYRRGDLYLANLGVPVAAIGLLDKVQVLKYAIQDKVYG